MKKTAKQLIEELSSSQCYDIGRAMERVSIKTSSSCGYATQQEEWNTVARLARMTLPELAKALAEIKGEGFEGVEGLWELTKEPTLWPLTDYAEAGKRDQYVISYLYGNTGRLAAWERAVGKDLDAMAVSLAQLLDGHNHGRIVRFEYDATAESNETAMGWEIDDVLDTLIKYGWPVEDRRREGTVVLGGTTRSEVSRILDQD